MRRQRQQRAYPMSTLGAQRRHARGRERGGAGPPRWQRADTAQGNRRATGGGRSSHLPDRRGRWLGRPAPAQSQRYHARHRRRFRFAGGGAPRLRVQFGLAMSLGQQRQQRLLAAMAEAGIDAIVLYGNAWQSDYLRYAADFGILEGQGIAVVASGGTTELFLDSATEAERAGVETPGATIHFAADIVRAV